MSRNRLQVAVSVVLLVFLATACWKDNAVPGDPKSRLSEYIQRSFQVKRAEDKTALVDFLTGDARTRLEAWSDEQFLDAFTSSNRQFLKLSFREVRPMGEEHVNITYEVTYLDKSDKHNTKVTTKKLCELTKVDGKWLINDVHNIKELVEYQDDISVSPFAEPRTPPAGQQH